MTVPLTAYLVVGAILFAIGVYTVIAQRSGVMILMGIEVLLNAIGLNIIAFWRFTAPADYSAQIFAILIITIGAVEMAIGLAIVMLLYRQRQTVEVDAYAELKR
jgi:NADH-quinone oxidoreductase subunit K/NAD(P)H-quinone oxidoreductase subunit 4L